MSEYEAAIAQETFFHQDRRNIRELASLWDPTKSAADNPAYMARAQELEKELERKLFDTLEARAQKDSDAA